MEMPPAMGMANGDQFADEREPGGNDRGLCVAGGRGESCGEGADGAWGSM